MQSPAGLSLRGGALVLKSISLFLASVRNSFKPSISASTSPNKVPKVRRKIMQSTRDNMTRMTPKLLEYLKKETHFSKMEIEALYLVYKQLVNTERNKQNHPRTGSVANGSVLQPPFCQEGLSRNVFCELLHNTFAIMTEDIVMDRIFAVWNVDNAPVLSIKAWFFGLSTFLKGNLQEQSEFCFKVYDLNADGFISRDEIFSLLKNCLITHPLDEDPEEGVRELVDIVLKKMDMDGDGKLSVQDFCESIEKEPLLLQTFGPCLPSKYVSEAFLISLSI